MSRLSTPKEAAPLARRTSVRRARGRDRNRLPYSPSAALRSARNAFTKSFPW
jgi:hypothetical protein